MNMTKHFGTKTNEYLQFRPSYPEALFNYLSSLSNQHDTAWDCATGNGQAAISLSGYFKRIIATDINQAQLDVAIKHHNITYICCPADKTPLNNQSVDLITVAQALHWFNFDGFYKEVARILKPTGVFSAWCYSLGSVTPDVDVIIQKLYYDILGNEYWTKERQYIDHGYADIPFPFEKVNSPRFIIEKEMSFAALIGYLNTWSAVKEYNNRNKKNPIDLIDHLLLKAWGDPAKTCCMTWPIHLLVGFNK